jgi:two-component system phosphate regulon sensor histidine kinase PhoR
LQAVLLQAQNLARTAGSPKEKRAADAIAKSGIQMRAMLQDLVESVHIDSGALQLSQEPLALRPSVSDLVSVLRGALDTDRVWLEIPADLPPVAEDAPRVGRVLQNLLGNALKYSAPGTDVEVRAHRADGEIVLAISDRGGGISHEDLPRIFERFYRGSQRTGADGLGLGLYISRLIVQAHGGRIWCESAVGQGSTFSFTLPLAGAAQSAGARAKQAKLAE